MTMDGPVFCVSACSAVRWSTASSGIWKGAELPNRFCLGAYFVDISSTSCCTLWGAAASKPTSLLQRRGGGREAEGVDGEEEVEEEQQQQGLRARPRQWTTGLLHWCCRRSGTVIDERTEKWTWLIWHPEAGTFHGKDFFYCALTCIPVSTNLTYISSVIFAGFWC